MKLCVLSDSHHAYERIRQLVQTEKDCDAFIHLGDLTSDAEFLRSLTDRPVYSVRGNCDLNWKVPAELTPCFEGVKLLLCHGHERRVKETLYSLYARARELSVHAAFFGHTHRALCTQEDGIFLLNPGALKDGCYALAEITDRGELLPRLCRLEL